MAKYDADLDAIMKIPFDPEYEAELRGIAKQLNREPDDSPKACTLL